MSYKTGSQFVWTKYMLLIGLVLVCGALAYITYWSFFQTREWFTWLDYASNSYVSLSMALIFQYGQGPVLFLRGLFQYRKIDLEAQLKRRTRGTAEYAAVEQELKIAKWLFWGLLALFVVFGAVDAWTNREQMHAGLDAQRAQGTIIGSDKYLFASIIGILAVMVEEGLGVAFSLATHTLNDILEIHGNKRIGWLDVFADNANKFLSGGGGGSNSNKHKGGGGNFQRSGSYGGGGSGKDYSRPASVSSKPYPTPAQSINDAATYHTPFVREQESMFNIND